MFNRYLKSWSKKSIFFCFSLPLLGCGTNYREIDDISLVQSLLNNRQYDEAVLFLENLLKDDRTNPYLNLLLASALTGSVGIDVINTFDSLKGKLFNKPLASGGSSNEAVPKNAEPDMPIIEAAQDEASKDKVIRSFDRELFRFSRDLKDAALIVANFPYIHGDERKRMVRALLALQEIPSGTRHYQVAQLYSSLINLTQFLNFLRDAIPVAKRERPEWYLTLYCELDINQFLSDLATSTSYLANSLDALRNAKSEPGNQVYENLTLAASKAKYLGLLQSEHGDIIQLTSTTHRLSTFMTDNCRRN